MSVYLCLRKSGGAMAVNFKKAERILNGLSKGLTAIGAAGTIGMTLLVVCDVFLRYVLNRPIKGSYELVNLLLTIAVFFSFAYAQRNRALVHITFFMRRFPGKLPMVFWALTQTLSAAVAVLLVVASFQQAAISKMLSSTTASLYIPHYPFYFLMAIAFAGFALMLVYEASKSIVALFVKSVEKEVVDNWPA
jgi:TRAP-type C4-dicarboxylate transport system permease small subunit